MKRKHQPKTDESTNMFHLAEHPLIAHLLSEARDKHTASDRFRHLLHRLGMLLAYEAAKDLMYVKTTVQTPLEEMQGLKLAGPLTVVTILRAGLGLADGILHLFPQASIGHIGMFRDEQNLLPVSYYDKLPPTVAGGTVFLVDPMLATGGSAVAAVSLLHSRGCRDIRLICLVAAPEGLRKLHEEHPQLPVYAAALDRELDDRGYILPGLGDAGDRLFGTGTE